MTKQDEKLRLRRRMQNQAVDVAAKNDWQEAVRLNLELMRLGEDADTHNRLGKAYFELGQLENARDSYQRAMRLTPNNPISRKNLDRIENLLSRSATAAPKTGRQLVDLRLFITETGKTCLTALIDVTRSPAVNALVTGERVELVLDGRQVLVIDVSGSVVGRLEPKLAQRLSELMAGGNKYVAAVAHTAGHQIRLLIREIYQDPSQRGRVSFPGKLSESALRGGYMSVAAFDEYGDESLEDEDTSDDRDETEEETFGGDEEDLGLEDLEQDIGEEDDLNEE